MGPRERLPDRNTPGDGSKVHLPNSKRCRTELERRDNHCTELSISAMIAPLAPTWASQGPPLWIGAFGKCTSGALATTGISSSKQQGSPLEGKAHSQMKLKKRGFKEGFLPVVVGQLKHLCDTCVSWRLKRETVDGCFKDHPIGEKGHACSLWVEAKVAE
ncbi:hypothetical protein BDK51DRAFT_28887 [Blyttiomyces helicus]|uniref:Uncharacterized protein n=1 Tax=Blyttiomyces helicus TaxID=388810 RepID=A0A4V1IQV4_9FUNG|nr:hypothetical protein BDK51DRAFT_28887 [Blyttiomyces helicus]|eukprot:RKO87867.1 hypothetical protein BDK51DRAFT_28887 [Blyttiomyces helicus]